MATKNSDDIVAKKYETGDTLSHIMFDVIRNSRWVVVLILITAITVRAGDDFKQAITPREWSFPRDHGRHDGYKLEWWYFTGNLQDSAGRRFGYQLTFFRSALASTATSRPSKWGMNDIYFAHAAVTDVAGNKFIFKDRLERARPGLASASNQTMDVSLLDWSAKLVDGTIILKSPEKDFAIDLQLSGGQGPVLEGPGGVNIKGHEPGQASYYYSMTRLKTTGTIALGGPVFQVDGLSWMDHEFSSDALAKNQVGWDWMGVQLIDGNDLMVYRMRNSNGSTDYLSGTLITDGQPRYLSEHELKIEGDNVWTSPTSGASYPQQWKVQIAGQPAITVVSELAGQELITTSSTKVTYFEGSAVVKNASGIEIGRGYLEMTGYAKEIK